MPARLSQQKLRPFRVVGQRLQVGGHEGAPRHERTDGGFGKVVIDLLPDPLPVHQKRQGIPHPFVLKEGIFLVVADVVVLGQQIFEFAQYPLAELRRAGPLHVLVRKKSQSVQFAPQQSLKTGVGVLDDLEDEILQRRRRAVPDPEVAGIAAEDETPSGLPAREDVGAAAHDHPVAFVVVVELFAVELALGRVEVPGQGRHPESGTHGAVIGFVPLDGEFVVIVDLDAVEVLVVDPQGGAVHIGVFYRIGEEFEIFGGDFHILVPFARHRVGEVVPEDLFAELDAVAFPVRRDRPAFRQQRLEAFRVPEVPFRERGHAEAVEGRRHGFVGSEGIQIARFRLGGLDHPAPRDCVGVVAGAVGDDGFFFGLRRRRDGHFAGGGLRKSPHDPGAARFLQAVGEDVVGLPEPVQRRGDEVARSRHGQRQEREDEFQIAAVHGVFPYVFSAVTSGRS